MSDAAPIVQRWGGPPPIEAAIRHIYAIEGLHPYAWDNGPHHTYPVHEHSYEKVLRVVRGSIRFELPVRGRSRAQGLPTKAVAARVGRREAWVKERLKLCDLPAEVQEIYRHSARMTVQQAVALHGYTRGGRDNTGFPALLVALASGLDQGHASITSLPVLVGMHPTLVRSIHDADDDGSGWWGGHYFNTREVCRRCPFAAYRRGYRDGLGYCLMPDHYAAMWRQGKEAYDARRAARDGGTRPLGGLPSTTTPAQTDKETRTHHPDQKAADNPTVQAITWLVDQVASLNGIDMATLCAYTLATPYVSDEAVQIVAKRHDLRHALRVEATPSREQIGHLRALGPVDMVRYTLEALRLTQALRVRDGDPQQDAG